MTGTEIVLDILALVMDKREVSFSTIKETFGINQSTASRHLRMMCEKDFLSKNADGLYCLGYNMEKFEGGSRSDHFYHILDELVAKLREENHMTTQYIDFSFGKLTCRSKHMVENGVTMQEVGTVRINYCFNPWGIIFISEHMDQWSKLVDKKWPFVGSEAMVPFSGPVILEKINILNNRGYVDDDGKIIKNLRRIAVPVKDNKGTLRGAVACGFIDGSLEPSEVKSVIEGMKDAVKLIG